MEPTRAGVLKSIRDERIAFCSSRHVLSKLRSHLHQESSDPLFNPSEVSELRGIFTKWFSSIGMPTTCTGPCQRGNRIAYMPSRC